jgi:3-dehydroquinate synthase
LEAAAGFSDRLLHGEAVALGMALAAEFSVRMGVLAPEQAARATRHLADAGLPVRFADVAGGVPDADRLMGLISQDKKVRRGKLTFVLLRDIGAAYICHDVDSALVRAFLVEKLDRQ